MVEPIEAALRWAWLYDTGQSIEQSIAGMRKRAAHVFGRDHTCNLTTSHFQISLDDLFRKFGAEIVKQGEKHNIDARAIAGAIAWEYEENMTGRYGDHFQYFNDRLLFGSGLGWGSMHTDVVRRLRPGASETELHCLRMEAASAIALVAEFMDQSARRYYELSGGIWIRDVPSVLALFYHTSYPFEDKPDSLLEKSAKKHKLEQCVPDLAVTLTISEDDMAKWVHENLNRLSAFATTPRPPATWFAHVDVK